MCTVLRTGLTSRALVLRWRLLLSLSRLLSFPRVAKPILSSHFSQCKPALVHHEDHSSYDTHSGSKNKKQDMSLRNQKSLDDGQTQGYPAQKPHLQCAYGTILTSHLPHTHNSSRGLCLLCSWPEDWPREVARRGSRLFQGQHRDGYSPSGTYLLGPWPRKERGSKSPQQPRLQKSACLSFPQIRIG